MARLHDGVSPDTNAADLRGFISAGAVIFDRDSGIDKGTRSCKSKNRNAFYF
jgi:hypothetical protein